MGRRGRKGRNISGILLLDKPPGMTSNAALQVVKRLFNACKAGHTGSLDPLATGVLPLCFGEATKFSQFLLDADKKYLARVKLGVITDSGDADGEVLERRPVPEIDDVRLEEVLQHYRGDITQIPSMFSALKVDGQPLYKLARKGIEVERKERPVSIYRLEASEREGDELTLLVHCSKGTYVRTLVEDIGKELGPGAHVIGLRRLAAGPFDAEETFTMSELEAKNGNWQEMDQLLLPVSSAVKNWPMVELTDVTASYLRQGQPVQVANAPTDGWVRIFSESDDNDEEFIGVGEILEDGKVAPRKLVVT
ncbi:MAG: tRNA pseudouridine(55) synthase TruB [Gammaproteobacteria bacterium]|jgi:tRNA pseudouridine55 synthase|nr:tRNA pseudouridine(55) synthase TruB [Gammaproteobacteria bacterium]MBT7369139.1 tRNA pseudouridine(55) synthase TruB [Gammaproteobacteria bacterium]